MKRKYFVNIVIIFLVLFPLFSCVSTKYISDLNISHLGDIHGGIGLDKPYWSDQLILCGIQYKKGVVIHPEDGGIIAFAEFQIPKKNGHLMGMAGWAEQINVTHKGKMRFRFFADNVLLYEGEISGNNCQEINLDLGNASVLRIETDDGDDRYWADHMAFGDLRIVY